MAYRLKTSSSEHQTNVASFLQSYTEGGTDLTLLPEEGLPVATHSLALSFHSPYLRNILSSLSSSSFSLSVPASSSSLSHLLELLTTGQVISQSRQELEKVQEVAKVLGISLGDCQLGTRKQGVEQEKRRKKEVKQEEKPKQKEKIEEREPIEWGKIKVESFLDMKMEDSLDKEKFGCIECNKQFKRNDHLKRHKLKHTTEGEPSIRYPCTYCDKTFSLAFKLAIHIKDKHPALTKIPSNFELDTLDLEKSYAGVNCPETFKSSKQRYKHNSSLHSGVTIPCDECEKQFSRKDKLFSHKKNKHSK